MHLKQMALLKTKWENLPSKKKWFDFIPLAQDNTLILRGNMMTDDNVRFTLLI